MNRKSKIIISVVGITIVLLALLSLTYAYYLTRIQGNTNTNSISITTADLKLVYGDGNEDITITGLMPGVDIPAKTFTVKNEGNSMVKDYAVSIEEVTNTLTRPQDLTYTLTCVQKNASGAVEGTCSGAYGEYPKSNAMVLSNSIDVKYTHEYTLKVVYENLIDTDQSDDMGSTIKGKVQIYGLGDTIDLTGTVANAEDGDYVQINSKQKTSQIVNGKYSLVGIEPGVHSLKIMNDGEVQTEKWISLGTGTETSVGEKQVTLDGGSTVTAKSIVFTERSGSATVDIDAETGALTPSETITDGNKFASGTLAHAILNNAMLSARENETIRTPYFRTNSTPISKGQIKYYLDKSLIYGYADSEEDLYNWEGSLVECDGESCSCDEMKNHYVYYEMTGITYYVYGCDGDVPYELILNNATLSVTEDEYDLAYYYNGYTTDNYVNFAEMCWRIVRISGDGSVKLVLENKNGECTKMFNNGAMGLGSVNYGYELNENDEEIPNYIHPVSNADRSMVKANYDFQKILETKISNLYQGRLISAMLKNGSWCLDTLTSYDFEPSLICKGNKITHFENVESGGELITREEPMYVGVLTLDEYVFAGAILDVANEYTYINNKDTYAMLTLSEFEDYGYNNVLLFGQEGWINNAEINSSFSFRPSINLNVGTLIKEGNGTLLKPYVIK